ncbi:MAG: hypothetical protein ACRD8O_20290 [Bryobacteraceae bacterium]
MQFKKKWLKPTAGMVALGLAGLVWVEYVHPHTIDRNEVVSRLRDNIRQALDRAGLSEDEKRAFHNAMGAARKLGQARREGKPVDETALRSAQQTLRASFDRLRPEDRERIRSDADLLRKQQRFRMFQIRQARIEAFSEQFGFPLGLLAEMAVSDARTP